MENIFIILFFYYYIIYFLYRKRIRYNIQTNTNQNSTGNEGVCRVKEIFKYLCFVWNKNGKGVGNVF